MGYGSKTNQRRRDRNVRESPYATQQKRVLAVYGKFVCVRTEKGSVLRCPFDVDWTDCSDNRHPVLLIYPCVARPQPAHRRTFGGHPQVPRN